MKAKCCPSCGRPILPEELPLPPIKRRILDLVKRRRAISTESLYWALWGNDVNGGPSMTNLYMHISQLNRLLAPHGLAVRSSRGQGAMYRLISEAAE